MAWIGLENPGASQGASKQGSKTQMSDQSYSERLMLTSPTKMRGNSSWHN